MPTVSSKRQITLPAKHCETLGIQPGDEVECFVADGQITVIKKTRGAAKGLLKQIDSDPRMTDEESLETTLEGS